MCRTRLLANRHGVEQSAGRGNIAFITINLPMLALESKNIEEFNVRLQRALNLCSRQLLHRYDVVKRLKVVDVPFIFGKNSLYMNSENLGPDDIIEPALKNGSLTIGFCGVAEACYALLGSTHADTEEGQALGLSMVKAIRAYADACCSKYNLNFSVIATPAETTAGKFAKAVRKRFGVIQGVTDKEYFTNSFHVPVDRNISLSDKMKIEGPYHKYCNGGHISYAEIDGMPANNVEGLYACLMEAFAYDIGYFGFNYAIDQCNTCDYIGIIDSVCPACAGQDIKSIRRVTGYFAEVARMGDGKRAEVADRVAHLGRSIVVDSSSEVPL